MFLIPQYNKTKELALNLENGLLAGQGSVLYISAHHQLDVYINEIVQSIYSNL